MPVWLKEAGPDSDIVISSRIRIARNLEKELFPVKQDEKGAGTIREKVKKAVFPGKGTDFEYMEIPKLPVLKRISLVENRLCSTELASSPFAGLILSRDEALSIMIGEEDHLRIQCLMPGQQLKQAFCRAMETEDMLGKKLGFAYDPQLGYLTSCPTNAGTGMRASVMLHLPALTLSRQVGQIVHMVGQVGQTVRGLYGEGSQANGNLYQLSNQITLGVSEQDILESLTASTRSVISKERELGKALLEHQELAVEDKVWRSYGIACNARKLDSDEFMALWSDIKWGISLGIFKEMDLTALHSLMMEIQPATLQLNAGAPMENQERDIRRAEVVRRAMKNIGPIQTNDNIQE